MLKNLHKEYIILFILKGCIKITANEETIKEQRFVKIAVEDTGPGMEEDT